MSPETILQRTITLRAYCDEDWSAVCAIHDQARPYELAGDCDRSTFIPLADDQDDIEVFHRSEKFVACIGQQIVGFVGVNDNLLSWLYVDPAYFGYGIGRELLQLGLELTDPNAWTVIPASNTRARNLYESEGFQVVHTFAGTYAGHPCTYLELALPPNHLHSPAQTAQYHAA